MHMKKEGFGYKVKKYRILLLMLLPAVLYSLRALHHLSGFMADIASVRTQSCHTLSLLRFFYLV